MESGTSVLDRTFLYISFLGNRIPSAISWNTQFSLLYIYRRGPSFHTPRTGSVPEVATWSRIHTYAEIPCCSRVVHHTGWWFWSSSLFSLTCAWVHDGRDCDLWLSLRLRVRVRRPRSDYICGNTVLKLLCKWLRLDRFQPPLGFLGRA